MSKVLSPQKPAANGNAMGQGKGGGGSASASAAGSMGDRPGNCSLIDLGSGSSIIEFLAKEQDCAMEADPESIFQEVSRLSDSTDMRSVDELLLEAERLIQQQLCLGNLGAGGDGYGDGDGAGKCVINGDNELSTQSPPSQSSPHGSIKLNTRFTRRIEPMPMPKPRPKPSTVATAKSKAASSSNCGFAAFVENLPSESVISQESTPKDLQQSTAVAQLLDNTDNDEDTMEEITEAEIMGTLGVLLPADSLAVAAASGRKHQTLDKVAPAAPAASLGCSRRSSACPANGSEPALTRRRASGTAAAAMPAGGCLRPRHSPQTTATSSSSAAIAPMAMYSERVVAAPVMVSTLSSPIEHIASSITREHALKHEIEQLQEQLKDTEERLASVRVQNETLSQMQRSLRDHNARLQEESEMLKLDVQHLNECANVLRTELQAARKDRSEALQLQQSLRGDLDEAQLERRRAHEHKEKDGRVIQDLQRQCREMERILMRKHPDSVSALIVASKSPGICGLNDQENINASRKLLEQRIAQLESDAKEQDRKAQQILANVQARFNSVQSKYETHIADLETQVLSLQEINTKLNEQIESQVRTLDRYMQKRADKYYNNCTQTEEALPLTLAEHACTTTGTQTNAAGSGPMRDHSTNTIGCPSPSLCQQHHPAQPQPHSANSSNSSTANSTPNTSRPNSKQSGGQRRPGGAALHLSKLPVSQSDSTLSQLSHGSAAHASKEESQLLSSVRSMRVDLAIKNKAMQRLTRELDDCKKTIRKMQRDRERDRDSSCTASANKADAKAHMSSSSLGLAGNQRRGHDHDHIPATTENQALKEAQNKYRLLEADYKTLNDKRLHDLKTLQSAHERELASCNETVRILQQRLNEREEAFATQKRRKMPVDYYALKAKVSLLERRHSEREERLHMLVEALSKGRLNGALEDLLQENNNK